MNAKDEVLEIAGNEELLAICIGAKDGSWATKSVPKFFVGAKQVKVALGLLDVEFDDGYGGEEGPTLYAWTANKVIFKAVYDGSEWYTEAPRNPAPEMPVSYGGG